MVLLPPPEHDYTTHEVAYTAVLKWAMHEGYGISRKRSKPDNSDTKTSHYYQCDYHSNYQPKGIIRRTGSRSRGCEFRFKVYLTTLDTWRVYIIFHAHSHSRSSHPIGHPCHRKLDTEAKNLVKSLSSNGVATRAISSTIRRDPQRLITSKDISNERQLIRQDYLQGRTAIESLIDELQADDSVWKMRLSLNHERRVTALFFAHQNQINLMRAYPDVLLLDCTYRTNRYKMPLLHILGVSSTQKQFSAGFCFLSGEEHDDYLWAIESFEQTVFHGLSPLVIVTDNEAALRNACIRIFPTSRLLLCIWHVQQNVLGKAKNAWRVADAATPQEVLKMQELREGFMQAWSQVVIPILTSIVTS
jgi:hypothetical protein